MGPAACTEPQCLYKGALYFTYLMGTVELIGDLCLGAAVYWYFPINTVLKTIRNSNSDCKLNCNMVTGITFTTYIRHITATQFPSLVWIRTVWKMSTVLIFALYFTAVCIVSHWFILIHRIVGCDVARKTAVICVCSVQNFLNGSVLWPFFWNF